MSPIGHRVGLGLYNHISALQATLLELVLLAAGSVLYIVSIRRSGKPRSA